jgi:hypothetical protein
MEILNKETLEKKTTQRLKGIKRSIEAKIGKLYCSYGYHMWGNGHEPITCKCENCIKYKKEAYELGKPITIINKLLIERKNK